MQASPVRWRTGPLTDSEDAACRDRLPPRPPGLNIAHLIGETERLPSTICLPVHSCWVFDPGRASLGLGHGLFPQLFVDRFGVVYHCFDPCHLRLPHTGLSSARAVCATVFRQIVCVAMVAKEILSRVPPTNQTAGRSLRPQSSPADPNVLDGVRTEDMSCPGTAQLPGRRLRVYLSSSREHGARAKLSRHRPQICHQDPITGSSPANVRPLHPLLLLLLDEPLGPW